MAAPTDRKITPLFWIIIGLVILAAIVVFLYYDREPAVFEDSDTPVTTREEVLPVAPPTVGAPSAGPQAIAPGGAPEGVSSGPETTPPGGVERPND